MTNDAQAQVSGPYRAEFGAIIHEEMNGFLFTVSPQSFAVVVAKGLNALASVPSAPSRAGADEAARGLGPISRGMREKAEWHISIGRGRDTVFSSADILDLITALGKPERMATDAHASDLLRSNLSTLIETRDRLLTYGKRTSELDGAIEDTMAFLEKARSAPSPSKPLPHVLVTTEMVDAAMVEMQNMHPPMRRSHCERLILAALSIPAVLSHDHASGETQAALSVAGDTHAGGVNWPKPKVANPDIPAPTGVPYVDSLIHQLLDTQQDINREANERMSQPLCDASSLLEEVEQALRLAAAHLSTSTVEVESEPNPQETARIALLEQQLRWCRPRLSRDVYRDQLDMRVSLPQASPLDEPPVVSSAVDAGNVG